MKLKIAKELVSWENYTDKEEKAFLNGWEMALKYLEENSMCLGSIGPDGISTGCDTIKLINKELNDEN